MGAARAVESDGQLAFVDIGVSDAQAPPSTRGVEDGACWHRVIPGDVAELRGDVHPHALCGVSCGCPSSERRVGECIWTLARPLASVLHIVTCRWTSVEQVHGAVVRVLGEGCGALGV
mgnify:FL=1